MHNSDPVTPQPQVILVPPNGGGGGGIASRIGGAIIASGLVSGVGYLATYTTLAARLWLTREGAKVEMPADTKGTPDIVTRGRVVLDSTIGKIKEELNKTRETATGGVEKAQKTGAKVAKHIGHKVDTVTDDVKQALALRHEAAQKKAEQDAEQLAVEKAKYEEWAQKFREHYDSQCPNPRCRAPLRTRAYPINKSVSCARCQAIFTVRRARAIGPPQPPPFRSNNRALFGGLFGR